jgi:O-antigen/teichoic acid export membrane protein
MWVSMDRGVRLVSGLVVGAWVARYLGPDGFGTLSHALALTGMFALLLHLGLDVAVLRDLSRYPARRDEILATHLRVRLCGGLVALVCVQALLFLTDASRELWLFSTMIGVGMMWRACELSEIADNAERNLRRPACVRIAALMAGAAIKVSLIITGAPLWAFGVAVALDTAFVGAFFFVLGFGKRHAISGSQFSWDYLRTMRGEAGWALGAAFCMTALARFDQVLLGFVVNESAVGEYSAAVRLVEALQIVPVAILTTLTPTLFAHAASDPAAFSQATIRMQRVIGGTVVFGAFLVTMSASLVVGLLYGPEFKSTVRLLQGIVWIGVATVIISINSRWLYARNLSYWNFRMLLGGAVVAVVLNVVLIPLIGVNGALIGSLCGYVMAALIGPIISPEVRPLARLWVVALTGRGHDKHLRDEDNA